MAVETEAGSNQELALAQTDINWDRLDKTRFHIIGAILFTAQSALTHPTAVVKTRTQVAASGLSHMSGLSVFKHIIKSDGVPGIFRGFGTTICNGAYDIVRKVIKAEGVRGLYRGFGLTALTQSPASALWWGAYGAAQHIIWRRLGYGDDLEQKPSHVELVTVQATAGMVAGACSSIITTPIDTVKTRLQVIDDYGVGRPSVMKTTKALIKEDGWRGFYRGFGPRFLNMSFYGTTMIVTYELIKRSSIKQH